MIDLIPTITPEWRADVVGRMRELNLSASQLARRVGTSQAAIAYVLDRAKTSALVPRIDAALASAQPQPEERRPPEAIGEIAALREARDAIHEDLLRLEVARSAVEERIAEAYEHRAKLELRIRELQAGGAP